jgi:homoserine kinase
MAKKFKIKDGLCLKIKKNIPAGFGMGSSAASAAAAAVAFDRLFGLKLNPDLLVQFAGIGEKASAGSVHYDNVAASVLGGFVIVRTNPFNVIKIEPPKDLVLCVAIPKIDVPQKKTQVSRSVLPKEIKLSEHVKNLANAAAIAAGFVKKDSELIGRSISDIIVEPARKHLIPGFDRVKTNALKAGALGVTISGAGPSIISFTRTSEDTDKICSAMKKGFASANVESLAMICKPSKGAFFI